MRGCGEYSLPPAPGMAAGESPGARAMVVAAEPVGDILRFLGALRAA